MVDISTTPAAKRLINTLCISEYIKIEKFLSGFEHAATIFGGNFKHLKLLVCDTLVIFN